MPQLVKHFILFSVMINLFSLSVGTFVVLVVSTLIKRISGMILLVLIIYYCLTLRNILKFKEFQKVGKSNDKWSCHVANKYLDTYTDVKFIFCNQTNSSTMITIENGAVTTKIEQHTIDSFFENCHWNRLN